MTFGRFDDRAKCSGVALENTPLRVWQIQNSAQADATDRTKRGCYLRSVCRIDAEERSHQDVKEWVKNSTHTAFPLFQFPG